MLSYMIQQHNVIIYDTTTQCYYILLYVQMLTMSRVFSSIVTTYVAQVQRVVRCRKTLTGSTKYQSIDGYFCDNVYYYCFRDSHLFRSKDSFFLVDTMF